jgi:hypothetical protein
MRKPPTATPADTRLILPDGRIPTGPIQDDLKRIQQWGTALEAKLVQALSEMASLRAQISTLQTSSASGPSAPSPSSGGFIPPSAVFPPSSGDVSGSYPALEVVGLQNQALPAQVADGLLKRNVANDGWEEVAGIEVDAAGALDGVGSTAAPLGVRADEATITINGTNQLETIGAAGSFTAQSGEVVTVANGLITSIV